MVKYIILDSDGTIFNSMPKYTEIFSEILSTLGIPREDSAKFYNQSAGATLREQFIQILSKCSKDTKNVSKFEEQFWNEVERGDFDLFPDMKHVLERLHTKYVIIVSTNTKTDLLKKRIAKTTISSYVRHALGFDKKFKSKEQHLDFVKTHYKLNENSFKSNVVLVADGLNDMKLAKGYGIKGIGIRRTDTFSDEQLKAEGAYTTIKNFSELEDVLARI